MTGSDGSFESHGTTLRFHEALPEDPARAAVIVVPDVWGLSDHYRDVAERLAATGYAAFAIDIYSRSAAPDPAALDDLGKIGDWIATIPDRRVMQDIQMLAGHINTRPWARDLATGITGFCLGGQYALMAGAAVSGLAASVSWSMPCHAPCCQAPFSYQHGSSSCVMPVCSPSNRQERLSRRTRSS